MDVLKAIAAWLSTHTTTILGSAQTFVAATLGAAAAKQIPDLIAVDSRAFQLLVLANILLGGATIGAGFNRSSRVAVAKAMETAINATPPKQGGFARIGMLLAIALGSAFLLTGCVTTPDGRHELSATGKASLAVLAGELTDRYLAESPDRARSVSNIRNVAVRLQAVTDAVTVTDLRARLDAEVAKLGLSNLDRRSVNRFLPLLEALLRDYIGRDELDSQALVRVNEFLNLILLALPPS